MKFILIAIMALSALTINADARLGDTPQEAQGRYGEPLQELELFGYDALMFNKSGFGIVVCFNEARVCVVLAYRKLEEDIIGTPEEITGTELEYLTSLNGGDSPWVRKENSGLDSGWVTEDGAVVASYTFMDHLLIVATREAEKQIGKHQEKKERSALEGL